MLLSASPRHSGSPSVTSDEGEIHRYVVPRRTLWGIEQANKIIDEYLVQGFILTLRQLYYQFVARDLIRNTLADYKRLGGIVNNARLAGLIDWDAIEDRTREVNTHSSWDGPASIIAACA